MSISILGKLDFKGRYIMRDIEKHFMIITGQSKRKTPQSKVASM